MVSVQLTTMLPILLLCMVSIAPPPAEYFIADRGNVQVLIDAEGRVVLEPKVAAAWGYADGVFCFSDGSRVGYMDWTGRVVVPPVYVYGEAFREGFAAVQLPDKGYMDRQQWGFIDLTGRLVVRPRYWAASSFHEGAAFVLRNDVSEFVDSKGRTIPAAKFGWAGHFSDGVAPVEKDYRWGFIDRQGRMVIPQVYARAEPFSEGLAAVTLLNETVDRFDVPIVGSGFIDRNGKMVIEPKFSSTEPFSCGLALVVEGTTWQPSRNRSGRESLIGRVRFIDRTGKTAFEVTTAPGRGVVSRIESFRENLAYVEYADGRKGYLDSKGQLAIELGPGIERGQAFERGLARVHLVPARPGGAGATGYVDRSGKLVWPKVSAVNASAVTVEPPGQHGRPGPTSPSAINPLQ